MAKLIIMDTLIITPPQTDTTKKDLYSLILFNCMEEITNQLDYLSVQFNKQGDLLYHEGPLLSHFVGTNGKDYFFYWVDADNEFNRWLVFEVTTKDLHRFFKKECSLLNLVEFCPADTVYYLDIDDNIEFKRIFQSTVNQIPESYLPLAKSFYNEQYYEKYAVEMVACLDKLARANSSATITRTKSKPHQVKKQIVPQMTILKT